jgi:hypothetical protein
MINNNYRKNLVLSTLNWGYPNNASIFDSQRGDIREKDDLFKAFPKNR